MMEANQSITVTSSSVVRAMGRRAGSIQAQFIIFEMSVSLVE